MLPQRFISFVPTLAAFVGMATPACRKSETPRAIEIDRPALPWVSHSRCLRPCQHDPATHVVSVDALGQRSDNGPHRFDEAAQPALASMLREARAAGHAIEIGSAYRTHAEQAVMWASVTDVGRAARPGHSEHELGLAVDLDYPDEASLTWLHTHAVRFGFVQSYPEGKQKITGFRPEPWHYRFVGVALAQELAASGATLEEYFRSHEGAGYSGDCSDCAAPTAQAACGPVTNRGECVGTLLIWCADGARVAVDCATSDQRCALRDEQTGYDCLLGELSGAGSLASCPTVGRLG